MNIHSVLMANGNDIIAEGYHKPLEQNTLHREICLTGKARDVLAEFSMEVVGVIQQVSYPGRK